VAIDKPGAFLHADMDTDMHMLLEGTNRTILEAIVLHHNKMMP